MAGSCQRATLSQPFRPSGLWFYPERKLAQAVEAKVSWFDLWAGLSSSRGQARFAGASDWPPCSAAMLRDAFGVTPQLSHRLMIFLYFANSLRKMPAINNTAVKGFGFRFTSQGLSSLGFAHAGLDFLVGAGGHHHLLAALSRAVQSHVGFRHFANSLAANRHDRR